MRKRSDATEFAIHPLQVLGVLHTLAGVALTLWGLAMIGWMSMYDIALEDSAFVALV